MHENMGTLSDAQRHGEHFAVATDLVVSVIRQMVDAKLRVREVSH
jgi:hypothetical protein